MEGPDTFTQLPIQLDPVTKLLSSTYTDPSLVRELTDLNLLHKSFIRDLDSTTTSAPSSADKNVPPHPGQISQKRSAQVTKLREAGNASFKKGQHADAIRMYGLAIDMAAQRPVWEPWALVREELAALFANRAQARISLSEWAEAGEDARMSVEMKRAMNVKAWYRRGVCLREMGRLDEASEWLNLGVEYESAVPNGIKNADELRELLKDVDGLIAAARKKSSVVAT